MNGFTFFRNYYEAINDPDNELTEEEQGRLYNAIFAYMFEGKSPDLKGACKMAFNLIKPSLDTSKVRSEARRKMEPSEEQNESNENQNKTNQNQNESKSCFDNDLIEFDNDLTFLEKKEIRNKKQKERKKEIYKKLSPTTPAPARDEVDFSEMTDEELVSWECPIDLFSDEGLALFGLYMEEVNSRKASAPASWRGKIIKDAERFERLKSHQEIMDEWKLGRSVQNALKRFLRHCYANGHLVMNDKLEDILVRLRDWYGDDEEGMCASLEKAINGGYYDIREGRK